MPLRDGSARRPEDERGPVDDESRGERTEQKVFQACFFRFSIRTIKGRQHIQRNGEQFEGQEDHDQVASLGHQHHAGNAEEHQGVVLAALQVHALDIAERESDPHQAAKQQQRIDEDRETVQYDHVAKARGFLVQPGSG